MDDLGSAIDGQNLRAGHGDAAVIAASRRWSVALPIVQVLPRWR